MPQFIVKKRIQAKNMSDALKKEKSEPVEEIWIDDKQGNEKVTAIGFDYAP